MSEFDETTESDPIADAILHGGAPPIPEMPTSGADSGAESGADDAPNDTEDLLLGKFKSSDDLAEAYKNLEAQFTQDRQRLSELEAFMVEEDDLTVQPWGQEFVGEPENEEQLVGWAERDPGAAAQWALSNQNRIPAETVNGLWEHWHATKPTEAMAWYTQQHTTQLRNDYEQELNTLRDQIAPLRDQQTQALFEGSLGSLEQQIPDLPDYSEKIQEYIDNIPVDQLHLAFFPNGMDTEAKIQEGVKSLYAIVRMREAPLQAQGQVPMMNQAFTQSRQGIADTGPQDYDAKINAAILQG